MKKTLTINLFAGPGVGKSTTAAHLFAEMKRSGIDCELISEYAKNLVYEKANDKLLDQIYIFGKQHRKHLILDGKVEVVITDSPLPLGFYYDCGRTAFLQDIVMSEFNKLDSLNFFLIKAHDTYNTNGRTQSREAAAQVHTEIEGLLVANNIPYTSIPGNEEGVAKIMEAVQLHLSKNEAVTYSENN